MASSHKMKNPNGDSKLNAQDKSIAIKIGKGIDSPSNIGNEGFVPNNTIPKSYVDNSSEEYANKVMEHYEKAGLPFRVAAEYKDVMTLRGNNKFDFDDILITPKSQTNINSRKQINPYYENTNLPLFTAPMDSVVDLKNAKWFFANKINVVLPRTLVEFSDDFEMFSSYGLNDDPENINENAKFILLDVANGHMSSVINWCAKLKKINPDIKIMAGNIANPATYKIYCDSGVIDYARVGIGNGNGCLTTQQTGVGYPMGSLIAECHEIKKHQNNKVKIVADGGMKKYSDIITALAIGADYVMVGSIFSKAIESSGKKYWKGIRIPHALAQLMYKSGFEIYKEFRGMSTKGAQKAMGNKVIKTSEGVTRRYKVEYTLEQWTSNFEDYLRSAMSYSNANRLENFIGKADYNLITNNAFNRFNK